MKEKKTTYSVFKYDDRFGNREEQLEENPIAQFLRTKSEYDHLLDETDKELVDVLYHNDHVYRLFWNKEIFSTKSNLKKIIQSEQILGLVYINDYKTPMVIKSEPIGEREAGFTGYRKDGKAIIAGTVHLYEDHIELDSSPVYYNVKFGCLCGGQKKVAKKPKAA